VKRSSVVACEDSCDISIKMITTYLHIDSIGQTEDDLQHAGVIVRGRMR
jgi:hypothetical protein